MKNMYSRHRIIFHENDTLSVCLIKSLSQILFKHCHSLNLTTYDFFKHLNNLFNEPNVKTLKISLVNEKINDF